MLRTKYKPLLKKRLPYNNTMTTKKQTQKPALCRSCTALKNISNKTDNVQCSQCDMLVNRPHKNLKFKDRSAICFIFDFFSFQIEILHICFSFLLQFMYSRQNLLQGDYNSSMNPYVCFNVLEFHQTIVRNFTFE